MVAPISGPFNSWPSASFADNFQQKYKQAKPWDRPLYYRAYHYYGKVYSWTVDVFGTFSSVTAKSANFSPSLAPNYSTLAQHAYNRAYEKLRAQLSDKAGWAENLAQVNKTRQGVIDRAVQLERFARALRKGNFKQAARALRTPIPSKVSHRKAASQNFLEWEFGIKPIMSDLESSLKILCEADFGDLYLKGRAREVAAWTTKQENNYGGGSYSYAIQKHIVFIHRQAITRARVTNPNIFLANQLGVLDLALPWKLVPFSFVVDWFVNVEQVISSVSDWYGVTLSYPHHTKYDFGSKTEFSRGRTVYSTVPYKEATTGGQGNWSCMEMERVMSLPGPSLVVKPFRGMSLQRAGQAIALVLSVLGS